MFNLNSQAARQHLLTVIAEISPPSFVFEPLAESVTIESPTLDQLSLFKDLDTIAIPASTDQEHFFVYLRPGDTINFAEHSFNIQLGVERFDMAAPEVPSMASEAKEPNGAQATAVSQSRVNGVNAAAGATDADIQVESSDQQPHDQQPHDHLTRSGDRQDAETDDETDDEDLNEPSTLLTAYTPVLIGEDTPATSNPTVAEIRDTPARLSTREENLPFSTAPDHQANGENIAVANSLAVIDQNSPLAKKTLESQEAHRAGVKVGSMDSQAQTSALYDTVDAIPPSDALSDELATSPPAKKTGRKSRPQTYSKRSLKTMESGTTKNGALKQTATVISTDTSTGDEANAAEEDDGENINVLTKPDAVGTDEEERPTIPTTSDPLEEYEVVAEAARRTVPKRKLPKAAEFEDDEEPVAKKRTRGQASSGQKMPSPESDELDMALPLPATKKAPRSSGKLSRVIRKETTSSLEDEIAVAQPSTLTKKLRGAKAKTTLSPQVIITNGESRATPDSTGTTSTTLSGKVPKVLFSSTTLSEDKPTLTWLRKQGAHVIDKVPTKRTNFVCVVKDDDRLHTTAKILRALALGKLIVTDTWLTDSKAEGQLLDPYNYLHDATEGDADRSTLFRGQIVYFTKKLKMDYGAYWPDIEALVKEAGAKLVDSGSADNGEKTARMGDAIFFGSDRDDKDVAELMSKHKQVVYHKDMLAQSVLRGELELESDEFRLQAPAASSVKSKRR